MNFFFRKSIFEDGQISVILGGLIFAVDKFVFEATAFSCLFLNKQKNIKDLDMKIAYTFAQCIYSKYYVYAFRKSLLWHVNNYHYFDHLNIQIRW